MTELLTAAQMRAIEQAAIDSGEVTGLELMERAGRGVVEAIFEEWPELAQTSHRAVVLCGPGNNGGDGFVVARLLTEWGWEVEVFLYGDPEKLPPDARVNYERWTGFGGTRLLEDCEPLINRWIPENAPLILDALFGTGLTRELPAEVQRIAFLSSLQGGIDDRKIVAIDLPSGICSDSGKLIGKAGKTDDHDLDGQALAADLTVTFEKLRRGHLLDAGPQFSGKTSIKSIGISKDKFLPWEASGDYSEVVENIEDWQEEYAHRLLKHADAHKYSHGHALVLSGGPGKTGAARLAARGALRIGAGLVTVGCPRSALAEVAHHQTAVMCKPLDGAPGLREMLEEERLNALCLGPGMGLGPDTQTMVLEALKAKRATVLDADALTRFERNPEILFDALHEKCVLTPHAGEFRRLFPDIAEKLDAPATKGPAYSKVDATREAAARAGCTILFKGPDTVIADPSGRCVINASVYDRAAPWLATAGAGDVLAGFITGLLARGFDPMQAAETAAWLHTECALSFGPGLIAEDLPEELPKVFACLFDGKS